MSLSDHVQMQFCPINFLDNINLQKSKQGISSETFSVSNRGEGLINSSILFPTMVSYSLLLYESD